MHPVAPVPPHRGARPLFRGWQPQKIVLVPAQGWCRAPVSRRFKGAMHGLPVIPAPCHSRNTRMHACPRCPGLAAAATPLQCANEHVAMARRMCPRARRLRTRRRIGRQWQTRAWAADACPTGALATHTHPAKGLPINMDQAFKRFLIVDPPALGTCTKTRNGPGSSVEATALQVHRSQATWKARPSNMQPNPAPAPGPSARTQRRPRPQTQAWALCSALNSVASWSP